jgi:SAM-dependent methyltransferase
VPTSAPRVYAYDNDSAAAVSHHDALSGLLDEFSTTRAGKLLNLAGTRCLDVAAGGGRFALWLAEQVGDAGQVIATDIKPSHIPAHPRLEVLQHDIVNDPMPGTFDFVHARFLLNHLPARDAVLRTLAGALKPGGVLLTTDFAPETPANFVAHAPSPGDADLLRRYHEAHMAVLTSHGNDRGWSRRATGAMIDVGLTEVESVVYGRSWRGGGHGCQLLLAGMAQTRDELVAVGLTEDELDRVGELLSDPRVVLHGHPAYATSGRRA